MTSGEGSPTSPELSPQAKENALAVVLLDFTKKYQNISYSSFLEYANELSSKSDTEIATLFSGKSADAPAFQAFLEEVQDMSRPVAKEIFDIFLQVESNVASFEGRVPGGISDIDNTQYGIGSVVNYIEDLQRLVDLDRTITEAAKKNQYLAVDLTSLRLQQELLKILNLTEDARYQFGIQAWEYFKKIYALADVGKCLSNEETVTEETAGTIEGEDSGLDFESLFSNEDWPPSFFAESGLLSEDDIPVLQNFFRLAIQLKRDFLVIDRYDTFETKLASLRSAASAREFPIPIQNSLLVIVNRLESEFMDRHTRHLNSIEIKGDREKTSLIKLFKKIARLVDLVEVVGVPLKQDLEDSQQESIQNAIDSLRSFHNNSLEHLANIQANFDSVDYENNLLLKFFSYLTNRISLLLNQSTDKDPFYISKSQDLELWYRADESRLQFVLSAQRLILRSRNGGVARFTDRELQEIDVVVGYGKEIISQLLQEIKDKLIENTQDIALRSRYEAITLLIQKLKKVKELDQEYQEQLAAAKEAAAALAAEGGDPDADAIDDANFNTVIKSGISSKMMANPRVAELVTKSITELAHHHVTADVGEVNKSSWVIVLADKLRQVDSPLLSEFVNALRAPIEFNIFHIKSVNIDRLIAKRGPDGIDTKVNNKSALKGFDGFRRTTLYKDVTEPVSDLAYFIMLHDMFSKNDDEKNEQILRKVLRIDGSPGSKQMLNGALKIIKQYLLKKNDEGDPSVVFPDHLLTNQSGGHTFRVNDWSGANGWSDGNELMEFCTEIVLRYSPKANQHYTAISQQIHRLPDKPDSPLLSKADFVKLFVSTATYDASARSRRRKAARYLLGKYRKAFKFEDDSAIGIDGLFENTSYQRGKNNNLGAQATQFLYIGLPTEYADEYKNSATPTSAQREFQESIEKTEKMVSLLFGRNMSEVIAKVRYNPNLVTSISPLVPGTSLFPMELDDLLTNVDSESGFRNPIANYEEMKKTDEALMKMVDTVNEAWATNKRDDWAKLNPYDLGKEIQSLIKSMGTQAAIAFSYFNALSPFHQTHLGELVRATMQSYIMWIYSQLEFEYTAYDDEDYELKFAEVTQQLEDYINTDDSSLKSLGYVPPGKSSRHSINQLLMNFIKEDDADSVLRYLKKTSNVVSEKLRREHRQKIENYNLAEIKQEQAQAAARTQNIARAKKLIRAVRQWTNTDIERLRRFPDWPYSSASNKDAREKKSS